LSAQSLPPRPSLDQLKRQAKELQRRQPALGRLRDAQRAIAERYGFASWDEMRAHVESIRSSPSADRSSSRTRRGLEFADTLPGTIKLARDLTPDSMHQLSDQRAAGVKIEPSVARHTLVHLARCESIHRIDLSGRRDLVDGDLAFLEMMPWLTAVSLARCESIGDDGVAHLRKHQQLEEINLHGTASGDRAVEHLAGKPRLSRVALGARLTDRGVAGLRRFPALGTRGADDSFLAISSSTMLTDAALEALGDLAGVAALDVSYSIFGSHHYTAAGVAHLSRMTSLEELNFLGDLATDDVLAEIARIPRLRRLMCQDMVAGDEGFRALARSSTLESIWGRHCHRVGDRGFTALGELPRLRHLALGGRRVTDAAMAALVDAPALTDLQPIMFGDEAFRFIARMPRLTTLTNMYNRSTTDASTRHLRDHPTLVDYGAHGTQITDGSLHVLADLPTIERLEFVNCDHITDEGLLELTRARQLRRISVGSCPRVSGRWVDAFKKIDASFDPADRGYVEQYRFWTLMDYPDLVIPDVPNVPEPTIATSPLLATALILGCRAQWEADGLHLTAVAGHRLDRLGIITRHAVIAPVRLTFVVKSLGEVRLHLGRTQRVFDEPASDEWTRLTVDIDPRAARLSINGVLRQTWKDDYSDWRHRVAIGPRRSTLIVQHLGAESV
jgi:hypothetical protein